MIDKQHDEYVFSCDGCDDTYETGTLDFKEAINDLKNLGWTIRRGQGGWEHYCEECSNEEA